MFDENPLNILLAAFFYEHGYLSIPELGRFDLSDKVLSGSNEFHAGHTFPPGSITFSYNSEEGEDPQLIEFITSRTRKMKTLAISDLRSLAESVKEMLNIRQSYTFNGIATIVPSARSGFDLVPEKMPDHIYLKKAAPLEIFHQGINPIAKEGKVHASGNDRSMGGIVITVVCLVIIGVLIYFLFFHQAAPENHTSTDKQANRTTVLPATDSVSRNNLQVVPAGMLHYEVVFEHGGREKAFHRYRQLTGWGHHIVMRTRDSIMFTLAVPFTTSAKDTTAAKDSIQALYGHPVYIRYESR